LAEVILAMAVFAMVSAGLYNLVLSSIEAEKRLGWRSAALSTANRMAVRGDRDLEERRQRGELPEPGEAVLLFEDVDAPDAAGATAPAIVYRVTASHVMLGDVVAYRLESVAYPRREDGGSTASLGARVVRHYLPAAGALELEAALPPTATPEAAIVEETAANDTITTATEVKP